jgi:membrane-bound ClpP family serine protease
LKTWKYWHDWATFIPATLLITTPFVFGVATIGSHTLSAWIFGAVLGVISMILALLWLLFPTNQFTSAMTMMVGTALFVAPWLLSFATFTVDRLVPCIVGLLLILAAGWLAAKHWSRQINVTAYCLLSQNPQIARDYRRATNPL